MYIIITFILMYIIAMDVLMFERSDVIHTLLHYIHYCSTYVIALCNIRYSFMHYGRCYGYTC